jgi:hypothetical protein
MSLINDALKRAKQAHKDNPPPPADLPFRPPDPSQPRSSGPPLALIIGAVILVGLAGLLAMLALQKRVVANARQADSAQSQTITPGAVTADPVSAEQPTPLMAQPKSATVVLSPATVEPPALSDAAPSTPSPDGTTNATVAAADTAPPKPAAPRLQGIFYRPARPSAVINGKNVFIGSRVGDFQVLAITQETVTISSGTETNVLTLAE